MRDYILAWIPAIVFLVCSYFHRGGLSRLQLSVNRRILGSKGAIHAKMIRNLRPRI